MFPQGANVKVKQPSHLNNFIMKNLFVKPLNTSNLVNLEKNCSLNFFSNDF